MGIPMDETTSDREVIPFNIYRFRFLGLEEVAKREEWLKQNRDDGKPPEDKYQWRWKFEVSAGDHAGTELWSHTARTIGYSKSTGLPYKGRLACSISSKYVRRRLHGGCDRAGRSDSTPHPPSALIEMAMASARSSVVRPHADSAVCAR